MKKLTIFFLFALFSLYISHLLSQSVQAAEISSPVNYVEQDFDVLKYSLEADLSHDDPVEISAVCRITFRWRKGAPREAFYFHLRDLEIDSAIYEDHKITPKAVGEPEDNDYHYSVAPPPGDFGDTVTISVYYHGRMTHEGGPAYWGGVHKEGDGAYALGVGDINYVSMTQHWMPCYDHPSDKALFEAAFRVKPGMTAVSNGLLIDEYEKDGDRIFLWKQNVPCATYLLTFAVNEYEKLELEGHEKPHVVYYPLQLKNSVPFVMQEVPQATRILEDMFGAYPHEKVGYVITQKGSMEHQSMISLAKAVIYNAFGKYDSLYNTVVHELAHQWFGDCVSPLDFREAWLSEGFATYATDLVYREYYNNEKFLEGLGREVERYIYDFSEKEGVFPLYDFPREEIGSNYPYSIYIKGAGVLHLLHYELGDSLFLAGLKNFIKENKYGNATSESLRKSLEKTSGHDLDWFFAQWVYGRGWPVIQIDAEKLYVDNEISALIEMRQYQPKSWGFYDRLPIELSFAAEDDTLHRIVEMTTPDDEFTFNDLNDFDTIIVNHGPTLRTLAEIEYTNITSVAEFSSYPGAEIYPNPAGDRMNLDLPADYSSARVSIYNSYGRKIFAREFAPGANAIDISEFPAGMYIIRIGSEGRTEHLRFVKSE
jgi:aminopeptidase N